MKIAIIGSGIAGLSAGYFLRHAGFSPVLLEKQAQPGMAAHQISIEMGGQRYQGDVPSRMFNAAQWPNLLKLYQDAGVSYRVCNATQSFSCPDGETYLKLSLPYSFKDSLATLINSKATALLSAMKRFRKVGEAALDRTLAQALTLREFITSQNIDESFVKQFLYPVLSSTVCTCSYAALEQYPASIVLAAIKNISVNQKLFQTEHGTGDVVARLLNNIEIRTNQKVDSIERMPSGATIHFSGSQPETFDHVVIATQANHVDDLFKEAAYHALDQVRYENVRVTIHRDPSFMPRNRSDWSTFNFVSSDVSAMCTVWMNQFHANWPKDEAVFQTIAPIREPDPNLLLENFAMQRPVVTHQSLDFVESLGRRQHQLVDRVWLCGSYASPGIPLLETAVVSAKHVCEQITGSAASTEPLPES